MFLWHTFFEYFSFLFFLKQLFCFSGGRGRGSGDFLMQNLPWNSWGTWHDWRQDLHFDSLMHFTLWWHRMLHSSWKRAYIKSQSSLFFSLYFLIISFAHIRSQRGPICGREIILPLGKDACGSLPWVTLVTWESVFSRHVPKVFVQPWNGLED